MVHAALRWYNFFSNLLTTAISILLLATLYMPKLWSASSALAARFGYDRSHEVLITVIYNLLDSGKDLLLGLPFSWYSTFVVEERHGFNKQTTGLFVKDLLISVSALYISNLRLSVIGDGDLGKPVSAVLNCAKVMYVS